MLIIGQDKESVYFNKKITLKSQYVIKIVFLIRQTRRISFQQVCEYYPALSDIKFLNCVLNFFSWALQYFVEHPFIDNILEILQRKKSKGLKFGLRDGHLQIRSRRNSAKKDIVSFAMCGCTLSCWKLHHTHPYAKAQ